MNYKKYSFKTSSKHFTYKQIFNGLQNIILRKHAETKNCCFHTMFLILSNVKT